MKRVYPAGPFSWQAKIKAHADELECLGYVITGDWLTQEAGFTRPDNTTDTAKAGLHTHCKTLSVRDLANIIDSDTLILFEPGVPLERNTRVAEFGFALAAGRQCIVIDPEDEDKKDVISSIFVMLDEVPQAWAFKDGLSRIKPVLRYRSWATFLADVFDPEKVECCAGCGCEYRVRDCGCPAGSYYIYKTRLGNLSVLEPPVAARQAKALASVK